MGLSAFGFTTPVAATARLCTAPAAAHTPAYGGAIRADVDGDGIPDRVHVVVDPNAPAACAFVLRADTRHGPVSGRIWWPVEGYGSLSAKRLADSGPVVDGAVTVDPRPGAEIVVDLGHLASYDWITLFTVRDRHFVQLRIEGFGSEPNTFKPGGSVCCGSTFVDCIGGRASGRTVVESFSNEAGRTKFEVRFYRLVGVAFRRVRVLRGSYRGTRAPPRVPAISRTFGSC